MNAEPLTTATVTVPTVPTWELPMPLPGITPTLPEDMRRWYATITAAAVEVSRLMSALFDAIDAADEQLHTWCTDVCEGDPERAFELMTRLMDSGGSGPALELLLQT